MNLNNKLILSCISIISAVLLISVAYGPSMLHFLQGNEYDSILYSTEQPEIDKVIICDREYEYDDSLVYEELDLFYTDMPMQDTELISYRFGHNEYVLSQGTVEKKLEYLKRMNPDDFSNQMDSCAQYANLAGCTQLGNGFTTMSQNPTSAQAQIAQSQQMVASTTCVGFWLMLAGAVGSILDDIAEYWPDGWDGVMLGIFILGGLLFFWDDIIDLLDDIDWGNLPSVNAANAAAATSSVQAQAQEVTDIILLNQLP